MNLAGQTAIVTGGGRGIGQAICVELAERGADIVIADLDEDEMRETRQLVEEKNQTAITTYLDLREPKIVSAAVETALTEFEHIDILVNNAGIGGPSASTEEITIEDWDDTLDTNLRGPFLMCREVIPSMKQQEKGSIVNIASVTGKRPRYHRLPYATSKMGLIGLTRTLAIDLGEYNINANAVCPAAVEGPRLDWVFEKQAEARDDSIETIEAEYKNQSPRGELVQPKDIAHTVAYLCSDEATRITGQDINVTAGRIMY